MTIFYLDFENGNDANDGLSFANRWKTMTNGATSARIAPGDEIRIMASPTPVSLGAAQWTDNSDAIVPVTVRNKQLPGFTSTWTAAANITATQGTSTTIRKTSETYLNLAPASGFTTGKMAHVALGAPLDLSAFQQLSLWFQRSSTASVSDTQINLCSDSNGDVPLVTLTIPSSTTITAGQWRVVVLDNGAALPSGINSISISVTGDPSTVNYRFCNVVACKAKGSADEITHLTLIGKNTAGEPWWYPLNEITDTELRIGGCNTMLLSSATWKPYRGVTESVTLYKRAPIPAAGVTDVRDGGSVTAPITFSGGWDRTNMSVQNGETWLTGEHAIAGAFPALAGIQHIRLLRLSLAHFTGDAFYLQLGWEVEADGVVGCTGVVNGNQSTTNHPQFVKFSVKQIWGGTKEAIYLPFSAVLSADIIHGFSQSGANSAIFGDIAPRIEDALPSIYRVKEISNNTCAAAYIGIRGTYRFIGTLFKDNAGGDLFAGITSPRSIRLEGCTLQSATKISSSSSQYSWRVEEVRIGGNPLANRTTLATGYWESQQAVVRTAGGVAWALYPTEANYSARWPMKMPLGKVAVDANKLVTVKYHVRRSNTALTCGVMVDGNHPGVAETLVPMTAAADTWEELTLTFTPTVAGVVELFGFAYGGSTHVAYFDDPTIMQAD